ncbi:C40 family peptidase [Clostridium sp. 19966]|uniref:C40 family peptidase n=1 Tax=Clostridium sp. 19966 TaxID=2768166 RepID=UPI0028DF1F9B|nr:NlpC/P60 family protein [Clostridium sp. 19966]MDT8718651.1 C40 family peptidase [Clostridium sp. 19966]
MKLTTNIIKIAVTVALVMSVGTTVLAAPTEDSLNQQKKQLENQKNKNTQDMQQSQLNVESAENNIKNINIQIDSLDSKIGDLNKIISDTNNKISLKEADIEITQKNVDTTEADIENEQKLLNKRMRFMYKEGYSNYISILISSKNFSDLLTKAEAIASIINYDKKVIKDFTDKKEKLNEAKNTLNKDKNELIAFKQSNVSKLTELQSNMKNLKQLESDVKNKQAYYMSQISDYKTKIDAENKQVQDTIKQLNELALVQNAQIKVQTSDTKINVPTAANAIIAYAYNFLGNPYVWGAEGEIFTQADIDMYRNTDHDLRGMEKLLGKQAFDCSGFTQYVYAHFGINIGRTTYDQINDGTSVNRDNLKPGDLIFFGTPDNPNHVGIYLGNNSFIEAPYSGSVVRISALNNSYDYLTAKRILN